MMVEMFNLFLALLGYVSLLSVILIILSPTPVHSVLFGMLFYVFFGLFLVLLGYDFVGAAIIIVYAGALMVMFLFVVMAFDLTRNVASSSTVALGIETTTWGKAVISLLFFGCFARFLRWLHVMVVEPFSDCFTPLMISYRSPLYNQFSVGSSHFFRNSLLNELSVTFYQGFSVSVLLCGLLLIIGLIGAVALTGTYRLLVVKRRMRVEPSVLKISRKRIVLLY